MALPDFENFRHALASCKRQEQSWEELFRSLQSGGQSIEGHDAQIQLLKESRLLNVLAVWDFYSSPSLDEAATNLGVKSWQVIEFVESLRDSLLITETDLIVYEHSQAGPEVQSYPPGHEPAGMNRTAASPPWEAAPSSQRAAAAMQGHPPASAAVTSQPKHVLLLAGIASALFVILVTLIGLIINQSRTPKVASSNDGAPNAQSSGIPEKAQQPTAKPSPPAYGESVSFSGIALPVTNKLCNRKGTFCIHGLATLVSRETGEARYSYSEYVNGRQVEINGTINVSNIERDGGNRRFTFSFRDDQSNTTPGYAAAGYFHLDQDPDPAKPGILTRFKTTESFGSKTPVGLENTSYLFPS